MDELCCPPVLAGALDEAAAAELAHRFRVLGDPARLRLLSMIAAAPGGACTCDLVEPLGRSQPTVSHHLKALREAGLIEGERVGTWVWYRVVPERLEALRDALAPSVGPAEGASAQDVPEVLFVCTHNAGRSQMAAGLLARRAAGRIHVRSAGSEPADRINPSVVTVMEEVGVDVTGEFPKPLTDEVVRAADVVITMGCGDACPVYPGKRYLDWDLADPAGRSVEAVRPIRDELDRRVQALVEELVPASS